MLTFKQKKLQVIELNLPQKGGNHNDSYLQHGYTCIDDFSVLCYQT
jgi:hypothetical protein